ncbi:MAG: bifunctional prephenate dehydrogenase/3-phosphoshikimate 1-carboxyvinyltransferase [Gammaproteobacteria bacterium]|nr:MAG: bifunctional prephenate dehydrogenase/3-phosphoshikimate 1-carboxyvinyltransferase [Pseudomonadota bacterium]PIE38960.1 MAG: bifunctional prephenate dehydrogenase/3-phosphoshikimate 1-carboxyvinyltransferase [Gammaproteobacteria bacterium]
MPEIKVISVIGLGLIGGSLARGLREKRFAEQIIGFDVRPGEAELGLQLGVIDRVATSCEEAIRAADLVVLAVPVRAVEPLLREVYQWLNDATVFTDVGSVKGSVIRSIESIWGSVPETFIPGHPIAGSEKSGVLAADASLFENHKTILTPLASASSRACNLVAGMWETVGAEVVKMDFLKHDEVLAATSHLPHLLAFSLVDTLAGEDDNKEIFRYAAGGFRDFTRIAASDPVMWHDIFLSNRDSVLQVLSHFSKDLDKLRDSIEKGDGQMLMGVFTRAKAAREHFTKLLEKKSYTTMNTDETTFISSSSDGLSGDIRVPGDKSVSHRSIMLGALSEGKTEVSGFLEGEDALATLQAFRDMGVVIEGPVDGEVKIYGVGMNGLKRPPGPLYLGNSGTSMRLLAGLMAAQNFDSELCGDESLTRRPMERVARPLREMGAHIETAGNGCPPIKIKGGCQLHGVHYDMPVASAQVKSCLLLAGLYAEGETSVTEPAPTRDHTERMLEGFGYPVKKQGDRVSVKSGGALKGTRIDIPADISSAAFFLVAASITPGSDLTLRHVGINPTRTGVIDILKLMGGRIDILNEREAGGEPVADIRVRYAPLKGIVIPQHLVPLAIDEFPVLFIAACCATGTTVLTGAEELRVKESDRIQVMADGLRNIGVTTQVKPDGIVIEGGQKFKGGEVASVGDHRIAMAFAVAGLRCDGEIVIQDCANVATSFPNFVSLANGAGFAIRSGA